MCGSFKPRLGDVDHRHGDAAAGARAAIRLADVGAPRLVELLQVVGDVRQPDLRKLRRDHAAAALEHAEDVGGRNRLPGGQRIEARQDALVRHERRRRDRIDDGRGLARGGVRLAEDVALERQDSVVVRGAAPQHRGSRHEAALGRLDDAQVACAAGEASDAIVAGVHEAHVFGRFAVEQRVAVRRIGARRIFPRNRIARQHVRRFDGRAIAGVLRIARGRLRHAGVAAVAIGAAQNDRRIDVHRRVVARRVAASDSLPISLAPSRPSGAPARQAAARRRERSALRPTRRRRVWPRASPTRAPWRAVRGGKGSSGAVVASVIRRSAAG